MFCSFSVIAIWRRLTTGAVDSFHSRVVVDCETEVTISNFLLALALAPVLALALALALALVL